MLNYVLTVPPAVEPVSLAMAKSHLRVDYDDDDLLITGLITAAREQVEQKMQQAIYTQTYVLSLDQFNYGDWRSTIPVERRNPLKFSALWESQALRLPMPRLIEVLSITYLDVSGATQTLDPSQYVVDASSCPARIVPAASLTWPTTDYYIPGSVRVTYTAGCYGDGVTADTCPQSIRFAILMLVAHLYKQRAATSDKPITVIPLGVDALISPYRYMGGP